MTAVAVSAAAPGSLLARAKPPPDPRAKNTMILVARYFEANPRKALSQHAIAAAIDAPLSSVQKVTRKFCNERSDVDDRKTMPSLKLGEYMYTPGKGPGDRSKLSRQAEVLPNTNWKLVGRTAQSGNPVVVDENGIAYIAVPIPG